MKADLRLMHWHTPTLTYNVLQMYKASNLLNQLYFSYHKEVLFTSHPLVNHVAEKLLHVFVSIEMTGQSVQFEQKFNYRRPMYMVLEHIWGMEVHKKAVKVTSIEL